jgi:hypothetical protein
MAAAVRVAVSARSSPFTGRMVDGDQEIGFEP